MHILIEQWRAEAKALNQLCRDIESWMLIRCANELEQAWHDEMHDATWNFDCALCVREMQAASRKEMGEEK